MKTIAQRISILIFFSFNFSHCFAQDKDLLQFSGVVVESDSLGAIPFTRVMIKGSNRGTISDYYGYFSFVAKKKDTILFTALGFKKAQYIIPDTLSGNKYSLIQILRFDTIVMRGIDIYPWPTREQFKTAFMTVKVPDDDMQHAKKNLDREAMEAQYEAMAMDGSMNYKGAMQQYQSRLYWAGQYPPNNLLNPFAWAQFIKLWRDGKLKAKKSTQNKDNGDN